MVSSWTKEDIRDRLIAVGSYDLTDPKDSRRLNRNVEGLWRWSRSSLADVLPKLRPLGPMKILQKVKFDNGQMTKKNLADILLTLREFSSVFFYGSGALRAAVAMGRQYVQERRALAHYRTLADIETDSGKTYTLWTKRGDLLVLDLYPEAEGKLWLPEQKRALATLRSHNGPAILMTREARATPKGELSRLAVTHFRPRDRYPIKETR